MQRMICLVLFGFLKAPKSFVRGASANAASTNGCRADDLTGCARSRRSPIDAPTNLFSREPAGSFVREICPPRGDGANTGSGPVGVTIFKQKMARYSPFGRYGLIVPHNWSHTFWLLWRHDVMRLEQ
jgi:hypothetical protein